MKLTALSRAPLDPFNQDHVVLCRSLTIAGCSLVFGSPVPPFADLHILHTHFDNGVVGTREEFESLDKTPVKLWLDNELMPIAMFVAQPDKEKAPVEAKEERGIFHIENAKLLATKKDIQGYAKSFGITIKVESAVSIKKMILKLEVLAKKKGLIEE